MEFPSFSNTKVNQPIQLLVIRKSNKIIKIICNTYKIDKVENRHKELEKIASLLKKQANWSVHAMSCELNHSDSTTWNVLHGYSHNLEHYIDILSFLSRTNGWQCDLSCISEMVERVVSNKNVLVIGRMDEKSGKMIEVKKVFGEKMK